MSLALGVMPAALSGDPASSFWIPRSSRGMPEYGLAIWLLL